MAQWVKDLASAQIQSLALELPTWCSQKTKKRTNKKANVYIQTKKKIKCVQTQELKMGETTMGYMLGNLSNRQHAFGRNQNLGLEGLRQVHLTPSMQPQRTVIF